MKKALNIKVLFRQNSDGKNSTVYFKIFVDGTKTREFSTGLIVSNRHIAKDGRLKDAQFIAEIERLKTEIRDLHAYLKQRKTGVTATILRDEFLKPRNQMEFMHIIDQFITYQCGHSKVSAGTQKTYRTYRKNLYNFLKTKKLLKITIHELDAKLGREYLDFLLTVGDAEHQGRCLGFVHQVLRHAQGRELVEYTSFLAVKRPKKTFKIPTFLEIHEVKKLENTPFVNQKLNRIKDLFLFQCYTGFAYADLASFDAKKHTMQGEKYRLIRKERIKTGVEAILPFFNEAQAIWDKYKGKLPIISNQKYNIYLKEIAFMMGIEKQIKTHTARHTAGMFWLNKGMSIESVSKMLGHKSTRMTEMVYARVLPKRIESEANQFLINKKTA